ncbi:MAG: polysaccharide deacetylase [Deltaproteobacteria bacterium]|nr:MAG: polysaccharide deacetylase [Deltaproteobacteria bacterium]
MNNFLTIDVEDFFQVAAFDDVISPEEWFSYPCRVQKNTFDLLDTLDNYNVKATFFIVGWIAEHYPQVVREIDRRGHEVGCHSYWHKKVYDLTPEEFHNDSSRAKEILEQITGKPVLGYRAPTYSITRRSLWALNILEDLGFTYDSSIFPVLHDNYGIPDAPRFRYQLKGHNLVEFPLSTFTLLGKNLPVSGGGYFRLFPYRFTRYALKKINEEEKEPFIFYLHPWEIDVAQPRVTKARLRSRFRHYQNLDKTADRFERLLQDFDFGPMGAAL